MSSPTPAPTEASALPQPDDRSARLMQALMESAGLRIPGDVTSAAPAKPAKRRRPRASATTR
jgi:hypothetical protein